MHSTCITMHFSIVFLALLALAAAIPTSPKLHAADQELLKKQQDVIHLLENIVGELPHEHLYEIGHGYEFEQNLQNYENPSVVKYYVGLVHTGHVQPKGTPFSTSVSELRKEVALLTQIFLGAKDYETFLNTAAWARVYVNEHQFVKAFSSAVLQRHDTHGVILPAPYEVFPHYFFDSRIIQKVHDYVEQHGFEHHTGEGEHGHGVVHHIYVNYTSHLPHGEHKIGYFTEDIGLGAYYAYVQLAGYMLPYGQHVQKYGPGGYQQGGEEGQHHHHIGHGSHYYYIHQQLLARYNLERLGQGLGPIRHLDDYYEHIETPFHSRLHHHNGVALPGRDEHILITPGHHHYELVKLVRALERRIVDAIHSGHIITPQGAFLSLYQPQGLNILGELIEGTGHSVNPRYYGSFQAVAKQLLGNAPEFHNIWEYNPSALEHGLTAVRDPIFYQLYAKIVQFFHHYQQALPAYQYNDIVVPGVKVENVEVDDLITYFSDYEVDVSNAVPQPAGHHQERQSYPTVVAHLKRLDHKPYEYTIHVQSEKTVPGAVVRVYVGPKYNHEGQSIDINEHRHYFYELDQFVYDLTEGHNVIVRNSHQATGQSYDHPSVHHIIEHVEGAIRSQNPYYIAEPQQLYGFPARLTLPKGTTEGYPLQFFVIVTSSAHHQPEHYGPVVEEEFRTYQPHHYQIVGTEEYQQYAHHPVDKVHGGHQIVEVVPDFEGQIVTEGNWHWGYLYKKYPGSYYYPHWQQTYYGQGGVRGHHHGGVHHEHEHYTGEQHVGKHGVGHGTGYTGGEYHGVGTHQQHGIHHQHGVNHQEGYQSVHQGYGHGHGHAHAHGHAHESQYHGETRGDYHGEYLGSGHYPGATEYHGTYPTGTYQGWKGHEEYVHNYYQNKYIGDIIGGAISLDGKPLGYPFDRPLDHSAFYAHNIYVKDVVVYHHDEYFPEY